METGAVTLTLKDMRNDPGPRLAGRRAVTRRGRRRPRPRLGGPGRPPRVVSGGPHGRSHRRDVPEGGRPAGHELLGRDDAHLGPGRRQGAAERPRGFRRFSPDERRLAFVDGLRVGIWRVAGGDECRSLHLGITGNQTSRTTLVSAGYSPDGRILAAAGHDGVKIWDGSDGRELARLPTGPTQALSFLPDGTGLITLGQTGLQRWAVDGWGAGRPPGLLIGPPTPIPLPVAPDTINGNAGLSGDGRTLAVITGAAGWRS